MTDAIFKDEKPMPMPPKIEDLEAEIRDVKFKLDRLVSRLKQMDQHGHPTSGSWGDLMWEIKRLEGKR